MRPGDPNRRPADAMVSFVIVCLFRPGLLFRPPLALDGPAIRLRRLFTLFGFVGVAAISFSSSTRSVMFLVLADVGGEFTRSPLGKPG